MAKHPSKPSDHGPGGGRRRKPLELRFGRWSNESGSGRWTKRGGQTGKTVVSSRSLDKTARSSEIIHVAQHGRYISDRQPAQPDTGQGADAQRQRRAVRNALVRAGLSAQDSASLSQERPLSDEQRKELARQVGRGRPVSEYILEEREGR